MRMVHFSLSLVSINELLNRKRVRVSCFSYPLVYFLFSFSCILQGFGAFCPWGPCLCHVLHSTVVCYYWNCLFFYRISLPLLILFTPGRARMAFITQLYSCSIILNIVVLHAKSVNVRKVHLAVLTPLFPAWFVFSVILVPEQWYTDDPNEHLIPIFIYSRTLVDCI